MACSDLYRWAMRLVPLGSWSGFLHWIPQGGIRRPVHRWELQCQCSRTVVPLWSQGNGMPDAFQQVRWHLQERSVLCSDTVAAVSYRSCSNLRCHVGEDRCSQETEFSVVLVGTPRCAGTTMTASVARRRRSLFAALRPRISSLSHPLRFSCLAVWASFQLNQSNQPNGLLHSPKNRQSLL